MNIEQLKEKTAYNGMPQAWQRGFDVAVREMQKEIEKLKAEERLKADQEGTPCKQHKFHQMNDAGELSCVYCRETIWEQNK